MIKLANPFIVSGYVSEEYFCDREEETAVLKKHIINGRHVSLISPRRLGKTGLIEHFFSQPCIQEEYYTFLIDIYATSSLAEFVVLLGKEIFNELKPISTKWSEKFLQVVSSLRPGMKVDTITGEIAFDLAIGELHSPEITLDEIFIYLEQADRHCIVAIDEFQQIANYDEKNVDAMLRTKIQHCKNVTFIYTGSKRYMMSLMFHSPNKPFYQSAIGMGLQPIPEDIYVQFAMELFSRYDRKLLPQVAKVIYNRYKGYTWYMQMMLNELFALTDAGKTCTEDMMTVAHKNVIDSQTEHYKELLANLATKQKVLLKAICKECVLMCDRIGGLTSSAFIKKYALASSSSVQSALKGLIEKEFVVSEDGQYIVSDLFFMEWYACV